MVQAKDEVVLTCRPKNENARFFDKADKDSKSTKIVGMGQELIVTDHIGGFFEGVAMSPKGFPSRRTLSCCHHNGTVGRMGSGTTTV